MFANSRIPQIAIFTGSLFVLIAAGAANAADYYRCVLGYCLGHRSFESLRRDSGATHSKQIPENDRSRTVCTYLPHISASLLFQYSGDAPLEKAGLGMIMITQVDLCKNHPIKNFSSKNENGILSLLGKDKQDVLKIYGTPTTTINVTDDERSNARYKKLLIGSKFGGECYIYGDISQKVNLTNEFCFDSSGRVMTIRFVDMP